MGDRAGIRYVEVFIGSGRKVLRMMGRRWLRVLVWILDFGIKVVGRGSWGKGDGAGGLFRRGKDYVNGLWLPGKGILCLFFFLSLIIRTGTGKRDWEAE